jgi:hypothetical protein
MGLGSGIRKTPIPDPGSATLVSSQCYQCYGSGSFRIGMSLPDPDGHPGPADLDPIPRPDPIFDREICGNLANLY